MAGKTFEVKTQGLNEIISLLNVLPQKSKRIFELYLQNFVESVRDESKRLVPIDTGSLQQSIRIKKISKKPGVLYSIGVSAGGYITNPKTGKKVDYAAHVEYGTSRTPAQPFLRPAFANMQSQLKLLGLRLVSSLFG